MNLKEQFNFLNSKLWLDYTHKKYLPIDDIKYRIHLLNISKSDWPSIKKKVLKYRKLGSISIFLKTLNKYFWYFPADCINQKIHQIETLGNHLFEKIENHNPFKKELMINSLVEESISSAIYEGANSTREKSKTLIASGKTPKNKDEWMLLNNYRAMEWIKKNSQQHYSLEMILNIHKIVTKNTLIGADANFIGQFRNDVVYVRSPEKVSHTGVPFKKIKASLEEMIQSVSDHSRFLHGLVQGIFFHYLIAYIHPFFDGNGRTSRAFFYFSGIKSNLKFLELLSISADLKQNGNQYTKSFDLVKRYDLDVTYFLDFCLNSLLIAIKKVEKKVNFLLKISSFKEKLGINYHQVCMLQKMALNKYKKISIEDYAASIQKSREIARKELHELCSKDLLKKEEQGKKYIYIIKSKKLKQIINHLDTNH